jgi:hypothetical protein
MNAGPMLTSDPVTPPRAAAGSLRLTLGIVALLWLGVFALRPAAFFAVGVNHLGPWFLDAYAILASNDAVARGLDPYVPNNLDVFHRPHVYSSWWLHVHSFGLTRAHVLWVGGAMVVAFLIAALRFLRPRSPGELIGQLAVLLSSPVLLALDRANNDLIVFALLAAVVPLLTSPRAGWRYAAAVPIAIAAGLKYYPAVAGVVLLAGTDRREVWQRVAGALGLLGLVAITLVSDFSRLGGLVPKAEGLMTFGGANLFESFGLAGSKATFAALLLAGVIAAGFLASRFFAGWKPGPESEEAWLYFVLGAVVLTGCFLTGTNFAYRWIFALWLTPLLWALPRNPTAPRQVRWLAGGTGVLLLFMLWSDAAVSAMLYRQMADVPPDVIVQKADRFFAREQPVTWLFFAGLIGFLAHFARERWSVLRPRG